MKFLLSIVMFITATVAISINPILAKNVSSKIKSVKVFTKGAEIARNGSTQIKTGITDIVFTNLSTYIDANSVQIKGKGDFIIQSVSYRTNYIQELNQSKRIQQTRDSLKFLQQAKAINDSKLFALREEEKMIIQNNKIAGTQTNLSILELEKAANFFRTRLEDIRSKNYRYGLKANNLQLAINKLNQQLNTLNAKQNKPSGEIVVQISSKKELYAKFDISYFVNNAGWGATYDLRATEVAKKINLAYKANVWQNTGIDWNNIKIQLSTGNPTMGGTAPTLSPWRLYIQDNVINKKGAINIRGGRSSSTAYYVDGIPVRRSAIQKSKVRAYEEDAVSASQHTTSTTSRISTQFDINLPYNIPSDNKPHLVEIQEYKLDANYEYFAAPKVEQQAFLVTKTSGWDEHPLLSGNVNVFYDGTYIGKNYFNSQYLSDTITFSLGRDPNVVVKRTQIDEFNEKKILGTKKKQTFAYEITVHNKKQETISMTIEDQYPLSSNELIKVNLEESGNASVNESTGKLSWKVDIAASESKKFKLIYTVEYPKNKRVSNL